jgi:hypothetical protein
MMEDSIMTKTLIRSAVIGLACVLTSPTSAVATHRKELVRRDGNDDRANRARDLHQARLSRLRACARA